MTFGFPFLALWVLGTSRLMVSDGPVTIPVEGVGRLTLHNRTENGVLRHQEASQFDLGGRLTLVTTTMPGSPALILTQAYTYSVRGERLTHTVNGTLLTTNTFDALSRLISQHDFPSGVITTLAYDAAGRRTLQAQRDPFASGAGTLTSAMSYNAAGQRLTLTREFLHPTGSSLVTEVANYDGAGRVVAVGDPFWPTTYTYDSLGRLTAVGDLSDPDEDAAYGFDLTGNLTLSRVGSGGTPDAWAPADAGNRLGQRTNGPLEVVYDPAGRLINFDPTGVRRTVFTYSPQDELLTVTPIEGTPVTRRYDALGRVYEENTVRKVYDGAQVLFDGEVRRRWGALDEPWGTVSGTMAVTHQSVNFLGHGQDDVGAFGEYSGFASAAGFQGRPSVGALNDVQNLRLWDHRARVYSPELKRFLTEDPHGLWGMNQYSYGGNDPVNFRDPSGLIRWRNLAYSSVGFASNTFGMAAGAALMMTPVFGLAQVAGGAILGKSVFGAGLSAYNMTRALVDDTSEWDAPDSVARGVSGYFFPESQNAGLLADAFDLSVDLTAGFGARSAMKAGTGLYTASGMGPGFRMAGYTFDPLKTLPAQRAADLLLKFDVGHKLLNAYFK